MRLHKRFYPRRQPKFQLQSQKELTLWEQRFFGYIGVLLAAASFYLAYVVSQQEMKIADMQTLISTQNSQIIEVVKLNDASQKQIEQLVEIQKNSFEQIQAINYQTDYVKSSTRPELGFTGIGLDSSGNGQYGYTIRLKNFGGRSAHNVKDKFSFFSKTEKGFQFLFSTKDTVNNFPESEMKAGQEINSRSEFNATNVGIAQFKNCFVVFQVKFTDALTGKTIYYKPFFVQNMYNMPYPTHIEAMEEDKIALQKMVSTSF